MTSMVQNMSRHFMLITLGLILTPLIFQMTPFSRTFGPVPGLHVVRQLPSEIIAGSTYTLEVSFVNPKRETLLMNVLFEVSGQGFYVGFNEFGLRGTLESWNMRPFQHYVYGLSFKEISNGTFLSIGLVKERFNHLNLKISSVPNLYPGTYTYNLTVKLFQIEQAAKVAKAIQYLIRQFNPAIRLCGEAPRVAPNTYWLVSDNLWAYKALETYAPEVSNAIKSKLIELASAFNLPTDHQGLPISFKHEAVIGDAVPIPFNVTVSYTLYSDDYMLKTDIANGTAVMKDWQEYADLLLYAALSRHWIGKEEEALELFNMAKNMWDGVGINDKAAKANGHYATYKLALLLYTSKVLGQKLPFEEELIASIFRMQDQETGGIITDYYPSGEPVEYADASTETTSIAIIALTYEAR